MGQKEIAELAISKGYCGFYSKIEAGDTVRPNIWRIEMHELQYWIRIRHSVHISIQHWNCAWMASIQHVKLCSNGTSKDNMDTYENALEYGLKEALQLIKLK